MTVREFYAAVGGDGEKTIHRFDGEERVRKYLAFMLNDPTFSELSAAFAAADYERAFPAVHTLKGVAANLGLLPLQRSCGVLTEELRGGSPDSERAEKLFRRVESDYFEVIFQVPLVLG